jgi:RND family efflux transporter MFP subunit
LIALILPASVMACGHGDDPPLRDPVPRVTVISPQRGDAVYSITLPGDLVGFYDTALHAKVTGYLKWIRVDKGDWVKQGQVLAQIEVPELDERLARARAVLNVKQLAFERTRKVWESDHRLVAQQDVDSLQGQFQEARSAVEELQTLVGYTKIIAPFGGVVTGRFADPGALIRSGGGQEDANATEGSTQAKGLSQPVLTLAMIDVLRVYVYVPEREVSMVRVGTPATLTLQEFPGERFSGSVARFATALSLSTRTMPTEVDVENPAHKLYPGMYANVTLELLRHRDALMLPPTAITWSNSSSSILVLQDGRLKRVPVSTGIVATDCVEVTAGISGSEKVVNSPSSSLSEGERVRAVGSATLSKEEIGNSPRAVRSAVAG